MQTILPIECRCSQRYRELGSIIDGFILKKINAVKHRTSLTAQRPPSGTQGGQTRKNQVWHWPDFITIYARITNLYFYLMQKTGNPAQPWCRVQFSAESRSNLAFCLEQDGSCSQTRGVCRYLCNRHQPAGALQCSQPSALTFAATCLLLSLN